MAAFLISPVRKITKKEQKAIKKWVDDMEKNARVKIHWPQRDTNQNDPIGIRICEDNARAIFLNPTTFVWWNKKSQGSLFDLGMAFMLAVLEKMLNEGLPLEQLDQLLRGRWILTANHDQIEKTPAKSFNNVLLEFDRRYGDISRENK